MSEAATQDERVEEKQMADAATVDFSGHSSGNIRI